MLRGHPGGGEALSHHRGGRSILARRPVEHGGHAVEPSDLVRGPERRVVGNVVGVAGKAIKGMHMGPQITPDQPRADREIFCPAPFARWRLDISALFSFELCRRNHPRYPLAANQATASAM